MDPLKTGTRGGGAHRTEWMGGGRVCLWSYIHICLLIHTSSVYITEWVGERGRVCIMHITEWVGGRGGGCAHVYIHIWLV